jgi:SAM-dependent methyltransferase
MTDPSRQTINDFGRQWNRFTENEGYYASADLFRDFCGPLLLDTDIRGKRVLDVGSGTGRIVNMLIELGASHVVAVEPSDAYDVLVKNTSNTPDKVTCLRVSGENIPDVNVDLAVSFGVLHHIPQPDAVVRRVNQVLPEGGRFIAWLYGFEGNEAYLSFFKPIHRITRVLPDFLLGIIAGVLNIFMAVYIWLCKFIDLPLKKYVLQIFQKMSWKNRRLIIFDQLNPAYAKYYREQEARDLLASNGFKDIVIFHRHGYSWTVMGEKK